MNLIIDIGNSRTKLCIIDNDVIVTKYLMDIFTPENLSNFLSSYKIDKAIISSVTDKTEHYISILQEKHIQYHELNNLSRYNLSITYNSKETLGKDRIAAAIGATVLYPKNNLLIIDAGTAITIDFVTSRQEFLGGNISPGLNTRYKALHNFTNKLPLLNCKSHWPMTGFDTETAITAGVQQGIIFEIDGYIDYYNSSYEKTKVVITGGDAEIIKSNLKNTVNWEPDLILIGLNSIIKHNV